MLISTLAEKTGLTPHTIRFYEKTGLLGQHYIQRGANNYRYYSEDAVQRLINIKAGQAAGFTLVELKEIMDECDTGKLTNEKQIVFLHQKMADVGKKIAEL